MLIESLKVQFGYTYYAIQVNTEGLTDTDALVQPKPGGNCLNWVVGHILATRNAVMSTMGLEPTWKDEKTGLYERGTEPITAASDAVPLSDLLEGLKTSQDHILKGLDTATQEHLSQPASFSPRNSGDETIGTLLAGLAFHEAYHAGQIGVLRRIVGKAGAIK